jgi:hypothetical protein
MLAGMSSAWPAETQGIALMAAVEEDAGDALVTSLTEMADAPLDSLTPAPAGTDSAPIAFDLAPGDTILPEGEEFFFESLSNQPSAEKTIIVTGTRVRHYSVPASPVYEAPVLGDTPVLDIIDPDDADPDAGYHVYEIFDLGLKLKMPEAEWNALSQAQKDALFHVLENYKKSPDLEAALKHLKNEGVEVVIRFGERSWSATTGLSYDFARGTVAGMSTDHSNDARTNLAPGSLAIISFNSNHNEVYSFAGFGSTLVHELLHPWVPNTLQWIGDEQIWSDHDRIEGPEGMEANAWKLITAP